MNLIVELMLFNAVAIDSKSLQTSASVAEPTCIEELVPMTMTNRDIDTIAMIFHIFSLFISFSFVCVC